VSAEPVPSSLFLRNRQRACLLDRGLLRQIVLSLLNESLALRNFDLGFFLVGDAEMTRLNETFLHHAGSTDVITFNYLEEPGRGAVHGEIFICTAEAIRQALRFRTSWQEELVRYVIHGLLHLQGYDDLQSPARQSMKRRENKLVREVAKRFKLTALGKTRAHGVQESKTSRREKNHPGGFASA
jgi:rRNA maturation RNase YbeY